MCFSYSAKVQKLRGNSKSGCKDTQGHLFRIFGKEVGEPYLSANPITCRGGSGDRTLGTLLFRCALRIIILQSGDSVLHLADYFDYERYGRELFMYGYHMGANNNVFRVL